MMPPNNFDPGSQDEETSQLLLSATAGDSDAIAQLLDRYLPGLQGYLRKNASKIVSAKESSSDLVQSVCLEVFKGLAEGKMEYRGEAEFKQWLYQAALLKMMNRHRFYSAGKRDVHRETPPAQEYSGQSYGSFFKIPDTPSQDIMKMEDSERIAASLAQLPARLKEVISLFHVEGLSHDEIAERLGIQAAHSRVLLSRALARLARVCSDSMESKDV